MYLTLSSSSRIYNYTSADSFSVYSPTWTKKTNPYPSCFPIVSSKCKFNLLELNFHTLWWPSVLLKYALPPFCSGSMYQLPHRSFAISGRPYAVATHWANSASRRMDFNRLWIDSVARLMSPRVLLKLWFACSDEKMRSAAERAGIGGEMGGSVWEVGEGLENIQNAPRLYIHPLTCDLPAVIGNLFTRRW